MPTCPVEIRAGGEIWVKPVFGYSDPAGHWRQRLGDGLAHNLNLVIAKAAHGQLAARHLVRLTPDSLIARLTGRSEMEVNSYHHQSVHRPGKDLRVVAVSPDGVIEALEDATGRFVVGVQWHPERGWREDPVSQALFSALIEQAHLRYNGAK